MNVCVLSRLSLHVNHIQVYLECGHVQGKHKWGQHTGHMGTSLHKCPICMIESERVLQVRRNINGDWSLMVFTMNNEVVIVDDGNAASFPSRFG